MHVSRSEWPKELVAEIEKDYGPPGFFVDGMVLDQPTFGFEVSWNKPRQFWKPFIKIQFWHWWLQIGWVFDGEKNEDRETEGI